MKWLPGTAWRGRTVSTWPSLAPTAKLCWTCSLSYSCYTANLILQSESAIDCKWLSYKIKGVDNKKWCNDGYELCFDGFQEKFAQNELLLSLLKTTSPNNLAEVTLD